MTASSEKLLAAFSQALDAAEKAIKGFFAEQQGLEIFQGPTRNIDPRAIFVDGVPVSVTNFGTSGGLIKRKLVLVKERPGDGSPVLIIDLKGKRSTDIVACLEAYAADMQQNNAAIVAANHPAKRAWDPMAASIAGSDGKGRGLMLGGDSGVLGRPLRILAP
jgi:hypothetical protein